MLVYYTYVDVNQDFNADILIDKYLYWLQNSKNKMKDLKYDGTYNFQYTIEKKTLRIKDFSDHCILGIQFITSYNRMGMTFVVEVMYDYSNNILELYFYHEFNDGTKKSMPNISIPKIFIDLLNSEYILDDQAIRISNTPMYTNQQNFKKIINYNYHLPVVVLYKNERCLLPPKVLSDKIFGIGHVVVIKTNKNPSIKIYYPNKHIEVIKEEYNLSNIIFDKLRSYLIDHNSSHYSFDALRNVIKLNQHQSSIESFKDYEELSKDINDELINEINSLTQENTELNNEVMQLRKTLNDLKTYCLYLDQKSVLNTSSNDYKEKREYVFKIIHKTLQELSDTQHTYRKRDILESLLRREHEILKHKG